MLTATTVNSGEHFMIAGDVRYVFSSHSFWTSSSLAVPAGVTHEEGHTHRIFHPPSFCCACLNFYREKDSVIPFPCRPSSRILCTTNDLIVLHPLGIFSFSFLAF